MRTGWLKLHYVWAYAVLGSLLPYVSLYAKQRGLSDGQVGWVYGAFGLAVLIAPPMYTALADRLANNRALIAGCYVLAAAATGGLMLSTSFVPMLISHLLFAMCFTAVIPLLDGLTFSTIHAPVDEAVPPMPPTGGPARRRMTYRSFRLFGSYGWMLPGTAFAALLVMGYDTLTVSMIAIGAAGAFALAAAATAGGLPARRPAGERRSALPTLDAWRALRKPPALVFLIALFGLFVSITGYFAFYPPYLEKLGIRAELVGLITNLGVVVEIGCMLGSNWLLGRVGVRGVLLIGGAAHVLRMALLAAAPTATIAIASQVLHGPTVVAIYLLPPMYLNAKAGPAYRNSMQGLYAMLCFGIARLVGSAVGHVSDLAGGGLGGLLAVFWVTAAIGAAAVGLVAVAFRDREADAALQDHAGS